MGINWRQIPLQRRPGALTEFDWRSANQGIFAVLNRIIVFGLRDGGLSTVVSNRPIEVTSYDHACQIAGRKSPLARTLRALKKNNRTTQVYAVLLDQNPDGNQAVGALTISGPAEVGGTLPLMIGGELVQVGVSASAPAAQIATKVAAAINDHAELPVTAAVDGQNSAKVNVTARLKGEFGNWIDLRVGYYQGLEPPRGVRVTIDSMVNGTANPDVIEAVDSMENRHFTHVVWPFTDTVTLRAVIDAIEERWNATIAREAQIWTAANGSYARLTTLGTSLNTEVLSVMGAGKSPTPPWAWAGAYGGIAAFRLGLDAARQLRNWELEDCLPAEEHDVLPDDQREWLLWKGISTHTVTLDGRALIERAITTRQLNDQGLPEKSRLDVMSIAISAAIRQDLAGWVSTEFPDFKLASDGAEWPAGMDVMTPKLYRGRLEMRARKLWQSEKGWVEAVDQWFGDTLTQRNGDDSDRLDNLLMPDYMNNLMVVAHQIRPRI